MPEMTFSVRWPDGREVPCYSPSLVMHDFLDVGRSYTVADFATRSSTALEIASSRVREKFGFACTSAAATLAEIQLNAQRFAPDELVEVVAMHPPLPHPGVH
ncbi:MAG: hypothetical protein JWQ74_1662 [Marmoricola sp.]|nr:hypothetical protein [Marmoricola sp.]